MKKEVAAVYGSETDALDRSVGKGIEERAGRLDWIIGKTKCASEHVGRSARYRSESGGSPGEAICRFVLCAISAEYDNDVGSIGGGGCGQPSRVAAPCGLGDRNDVVGSEGFGNNYPSPGSDRRGRRIDNEEQLHKVLDRSGGLKVTSWPISLENVAV